MVDVDFDEAVAEAHILSSFAALCLQIGPLLKKIGNKLIPSYSTLEDL